MFVIGELESEGDYAGCVNAIGRLPDIPKAVITNLNPLNDGTDYLPQKAAPLIEAGYRCLTECYLGEGPTFTPERMHFAATVKLGWPDAQPCFGIYNKPLNDYLPWMEGAWSVYLAEYDPRLT